MANTIVTLSSGNLTIPLTSGARLYQATQPPISAKVYYEITVAWSAEHNSLSFGYIDKNDGGKYTQIDLAWNWVLNGNAYDEIPTLTSPATFGCCLNQLSNEVTFYNNGLLIGTYVTPSDSSNYYAIVFNKSSASSYPCDAVTVNFGATPFQYALPEGFSSYDGNQKSIINKFLVKDKNGFQTITADQTWQLVSTSLPTEDQFLKQGTNQIPTLDMLKQLEDPMLYTYTNTDDALKLETTFTPKEQFALSVRDFLFNDLKAFKKAILTADGNINIIMSNDAGLTWYGLPNQKVDSTNILAVKEKGLSTNQLAAITEEEWMSFIEKEKILRFGYLLYPDSSTGICTADQLAMTIDINQRWHKANQINDYECVYSKNNQLNIRVKRNATYKINYNKFT